MDLASTTFLIRRPSEPQRPLGSVAVRGEASSARSCIEHAVDIVVSTAREITRCDTDGTIADSCLRLVVGWTTMHSDSRFQYSGEVVDPNEAASLTHFARSLEDVITTAAHHPASAGRPEHITDALDIAVAEAESRIDPGYTRNRSALARADVLVMVLEDLEERLDSDHGSGTTCVHVATERARWHRSRVRFLPRVEHSR